MGGRRGGREEGGRRGGRRRGGRFAKILGLENFLLYCKTFLSSSIIHN